MGTATAIMAPELCALCMGCPPDIAIGYPPDRFAFMLTLDGGAVGGR